MKKIIVLTAFVCMLLTSVCSAFKEPDPNRWLWITSTDKIGCWVDLQTIKFEMQDNEYRDCYKHRLVTAWVQMYSVDNDTTNLQRVNIDLDCEKFKLISVSVYDKDNKLVASETFPKYMQQYKFITPGTIGENLLLSFKDLWDAHGHAANQTDANDI